MIKIWNRLKECIKLPCKKDVDEVNKAFKVFCKFYYIDSRIIRYLISSKNVWIATKAKVKLMHRIYILDVKENKKFERSKRKYEKNHGSWIVNQ